MKRSLTAALILLAPSLALGAKWNVDTSHSSARFTVTHMMVSKTHGKMGPITGTLALNEKDLSKSVVDVKIDVTGIDTDDDKRDGHLKSADFFDVTKHPAITFKSKKVKRAGKGNLKVTGDLTIRGKTKTVTLDVEGPSPIIKGPYGNWRMGATATTTINRKDFGVSWNSVMDNGGLVVGEDVKITIDIEFLTKERSAS